MAGNITIASKFRPFSYQEMLAPVAMATDAHQQLENQYSDLSSSAAKMEALMNEQTDTRSYKMYESFTKDLRDQAEVLAKQGLTPISRQSMMGMRDRFSSQIEPIKAASDEYLKMLDYRQQVKGRDNTAEFKTPYNTIDDFLGGRRADNTYVSSKDVMARVAAKSESIGKSLYSTPEFTEVLKGQKYQIMQRNGATAEEIAAVLMNDPKAQPALKKVYDDEWKAIGGDEYSPESQEKIRSSIATGLYAALQKPTYDFVNSGEYIEAGQRKSLALQGASQSLNQQEYNDRKLERQIKLGEKPFRTDSDGTQYYSNGTSAWAIDKAGKEKERVYLDPVYDKDGTKLTNGTTTTPKVSQATLDKQNSFVYLGYKGDKQKGFKSSADSNFSKKPEEALLIKPTDLNINQIKKITDDLAKYALTLEDVDIYKDVDTFSDDHFRVVRKGYAADARTVRRESAPTTVIPPIAKADSTIVSTNSSAPGSAGL